MRKVCLFSVKNSKNDNTESFDKVFPIWDIFFYEDNYV
jgi:hypothetical protein